MGSFKTAKLIEKKIIFSLKKVRKRKRISQTDLAILMKVSRDTVARLESGKSRITLSHAIIIARFLDVSLSNLLLDEEIKYRLDSSPNVENSTSQSMPYDQLQQWSNDDIYIQSQLSEPKINPYLTMGAVEHYGSEMKTFILTHKSLWWWTAEKELVHLSIASVVEAILNFGGDEDIARLFKLVSMEKVSEIFKAANLGSRTNYQPEVITYFESYFKRHVSGYSN